MFLVMAFSPTGARSIQCNSKINAKVVIAVCMVLVMTCGGVNGARSTPFNSLSRPTTRADHPTTNSTQLLPIVLWHGMGDSCCNPHSIGGIANDLRSHHPGLFVHSISTGGGWEGDVASSYFGLVDDQVGRVCDDLRSIPQLQPHGYVAIGFSQGGQFLRAVAQRCQHRGPVMRRLVTMGSQHQGVMDIPGCWEPSFNASSPSWWCAEMQRALGFGAYLPFIQSRVVQAQYFKDPDALDVYYKRSVFLADINAEAHDDGDNKILDGRRERYQRYKDNLSSLDTLVLFQFDNDITVVPKESSHFGFYDGRQLLSMEQTDLYVEDRIGLKTLHEANKLVLEHAPGFHMRFSYEWFYENVAQKYALVDILA